MLSPFAVQMYQVAEQEMLPNQHSQYPQNCSCTSCTLLTEFKYRLSTYSKPVCLSSLAFILPLLEYFLFGTALSSGGGFLRCLINDPASGRMNGVSGVIGMIGVCTYVKMTADLIPADFLSDSLR
jgi:hypothetical protein